MKYKTRMMKRKKRYNLDDDYDFDWNNDPGKRLVIFGNGGEQVFCIQRSFRTTIMLFV